MATNSASTLLTLVTVCALTSNACSTSGSSGEGGGTTRASAGIAGDSHGGAGAGGSLDGQGTAGIRAASGGAAGTGPPSGGEAGTGTASGGVLGAGAMGGIGANGAGANGNGAAGGMSGMGAVGGAGRDSGQGGISGVGGGGRFAAGAGGVSGGSSAGAAGGSASTQGACDVYMSGGTPCVAAHSTVRALFAAYAGKLYQVRNAAGATKDIVAVASGGVADAAAQDAFCAGTTCVVTVVYDQTGNGNDLAYQGSGSAAGGMDAPASATTESLSVGGNKVYSLYIKPGNSYWVDGSKSGMPHGSDPEGMYMVTSGKHSNGGCCFDYGNSETDRKVEGAGAMDALNFSSITMWGTGAGAGPWVLADLEDGLFAGSAAGKSQSDPTQASAFVTAVLKNDGTTEFALRGGDATSGGLGTYYKGALPSGWSPMKKQGAIVLGSGGDCCATNTNLSEGTFYEGAIVAGYPSDATEDAVQANIAAAAYAK